MSSVNHFVHHLDGQLWHKMENVAYNHPNVSRLLALPISIGILIKDTLSTPAKCVEEFILIAKSIKIYRAEKNSQLLFEKYNNIQIHSLNAVKYILMIPFSPLVGIIKAIISLVKIVLHPFKTAKINVAQNDFYSFLEKSKYSNSRLYDKHKLIDFANETEFAKAAFNHFVKQILTLRNREEVKNLHLSKEQIMAEVALKKEKFQEARNVYMATYRQIHESHTDKIITQNQLIKLEEVWHKFQYRLIQTSRAEEMIFVPQLPVVTP